MKIIKTNRQLWALRGYILGWLIPFYSYVAASNLLWPEAPWGARQWHEILGMCLILSTVGLIAYTMPINTDNL